MIERAILFKARVQLLPAHPAEILLATAQISAAPSWAAKISQLQSRSEFLFNIPDITESMTYADMTLASSCRFTRRKFIRNYRLNVVGPVLQAYDEEAFGRACEASDWPYADFQPAPAPFPELLLALNWGPQTWCHYRAWSVIKAHGRWPLQVFGVGELPRTLEICPCCQEPEVCVVHMLAVCPGTLDLYREWAASTSHASASRLEWPLLRLELFADRISFATEVDMEGAARIRFVGKAAKLVSNILDEQQTLSEIDQLIGDAQAHSTTPING